MAESFFAELENELIDRPGEAILALPRVLLPNTSRCSTIESASFRPGYRNTHQVDTDHRRNYSVSVGTDKVAVR